MRTENFLFVSFIHFMLQQSDSIISKWIKSNLLLFLTQLCLAFQFLTELNAPKMECCFRQKRKRRSKSSLRFDISLFVCSFNFLKENNWISFTNKTWHSAISLCKKVKVLHFPIGDQKTSNKISQPSEFWEKNSYFWSIEIWISFEIIFISKWIAFSNGLCWGNITSF